MTSVWTNDLQKVENGHHGIHVSSHWQTTAVGQQEGRGGDLDGVMKTALGTLVLSRQLRYEIRPQCYNDSGIM